MSVLTPIPAEKQATRGWRFEFNGKAIGYVEGFTLANDRFGTLEYGMTPAGYDGWCFSETGGGGSVIVPYCIVPVRNALYVGLIEQDRWAMGGKVWNLPRGFLNPGETHFETAQREAGEELGFNLAERFTELPGEAANPNSAFFVTEPGKGVRFFGLEIRESELEYVFEDTYRLKTSVLSPVSKTAETIFQAKFRRCQEALQVSDMFTVAGVGRLLSRVMHLL